MNSTTWIIEPNGWAWVLLGVAATSLVAIAVCLIIIAKRIWHNNEDKAENKESESDGYSILVKLWTAKYGFATIIIAIASIAMSIVALCFCGMKGDAHSVADTTAIAVMGVLLTFSVAWSIWQVIDIKNTLGQADSAINEVKNFRAEIECTHQSIQSYISFIDGMREFGDKKFQAAFMAFAISFEKAISSNMDYDKFPRRALCNMEKCIENDKDGMKISAEVHLELIERLLPVVRKREQELCEAKLKLESMRTKLETLRND